MCWRPQRRPRVSADADWCPWPVGELGGNFAETVCQRLDDNFQCIRSTRPEKLTSSRGVEPRSEGAKFPLRASGAGRRRLASRRPRVACSSRVFGPAVRCGDRQQRGARERPCPPLRDHFTKRIDHRTLASVRLRRPVRRRHRRKDGNRHSSATAGSIRGTAAVASHRSRVPRKGPADRRSQLLGVVDEHDIAKRGEPKRIFGFEEQDRLTPIPAHGAGLRCHRLQIRLTRLLRTSVAGRADKNGRIFEELKQRREIPRGHLLLQIVQDPCARPRSNHRPLTHCSSRLRPSRQLLLRRGASRTSRSNGGRLNADPAVDDLKRSDRDR